MSTIDVLWVAYLNRNTEDAGSDSTVNRRSTSTARTFSIATSATTSGTAKPT